jgi:hypothetical protein
MVSEWVISGKSSTYSPGVNAMVSPVPDAAIAAETVA